MENKVELIGWYGDDTTIACSAWTSTSRNLTDDKKSRIEKLINMLWREGHHTPFEKGIVHFLVNTDIASHIHLLKHRISSMNAESARYKELKEDKYYLPEDWANLEVSRDVGYEATEFGPDGQDNGYCHAHEGQKWLSVLENYTKQGNMLYHQCVKDLEPQLGRKRAKESARFFKTYNSQIEGDVMFNLRSFANLQKLRNNEHAQKEIRDISQQMLELVKNIDGQPFKYTLSAWGI